MMSRYLTDSRAQQMRYNGRYPINEMWEVRQALMDDFSRSCSTNRYLGTIERQCAKYLKDCKRKQSGKYSWKSSTRSNSNERVEKRSFSDDQNSENLDSSLEKNQNISEEPVENEQFSKIDSCFEDFSTDGKYKKFHPDDFEIPKSQPTNAELVIKEEPTEENLRRESQFDEDLNNTVTSYAKSDRKIKEINMEKHCEKREKIKTLNETKTKHEGEIITQDIILTDNIEKKDESSKTDNVNCLIPTKDNKFPEINNISSNDKCYSVQNTSKSVKKRKSVKIKNYKQFVDTVSKLVNLKTDRKGKSKDRGKTNKASNMVSDIVNETVTGSLKCKNKIETRLAVQKREKSKPKSANTSKALIQKESKNKVIRNTRSSSRSAKINAVEKISSASKELKDTKLIDLKFCSSSKLKKKTKYGFRKRGASMSKDDNESEEDLIDKEDKNNSEEEVTSTSRQVIKKSKKRKSVTPQENDTTVSKYFKSDLYHDDEYQTVPLKKVDTADKVDEDMVVHSNCEENLFEQDKDSFHSESKDESELDPLEQCNSNFENNQSDDKVGVDSATIRMNENENVLDVLNDCENISDSSLIIVDDIQNEDETSSQPQMVSSLQPLRCNSDLDSMNNNKDDNIETASISQTPMQELWEYLKCDFCDFLVSKKKVDHFRLMEEHLESTKHNAASVVKVQITEGELKPIFVKKEHAILFSLEKASVLPYCPTCCTVMPSIWTVQLHSKYKHGGQKHKDVYCLGKVDSVVNIPIPKKINMCKQCGQRKLQIQKHWKSHNHFPYNLPTENQIALYSCNICHRHFESFFSALSHAVVHAQETQKAQNVGVKVTYLSKSDQILNLLPREKTLTSGRAIEMLNQARAANKTGQWTRAQRKEFEIMATEWKRRFKQY